MSAWQQLTAISGDLTGRRQVRTVLIMSLALLFFVLLRLIVAWISDEALPSVYLGILVLLVAAALLARTKYYHVGVIALVSAIFIVPFAAILESDIDQYYPSVHEEVLLAYSSVTIIAAYLFFNLRLIALFAGLNLLAAAAFASWVLKLPSTNILIALGGVALSSLLTVIAAIARHRDRAQIRQQTHEITANEARYRALFEAAFESILIHDNGLVVDLNRAGEMMFGYKKGEAAGMRVSDLLADTLTMSVLQDWSSGALVPFESTALRREGGAFPVEVLTKAYTYQGRPVHVSAVRDMTFRKHYEDRLRYQMRLEQLIANVSRRFINLPPGEEGLGVEDALRIIGEFTAVDWAYAVLFEDEGVSSQQVYHWFSGDIDSARHSLTPLQGDWAWWLEKVRHAEPLVISSLSDLPQSAGAIRSALETDGVQSVLAVPLSGRSKVIGFVAVNRIHSQHAWTEENIILLDIVAEIIVSALERARMEYALRQSESRFSTIFHVSPVAISISRLSDEVFLDVNDSFLEITGYKRPEVIGHPPVDLNIWVEPAEQRAAMLVNIRQKRSLKNMEGKFRTRSGEVRHSLLSLEVIDLDGQECLLALISDITERKRAETHTLMLALEREQVEILHRFIADASHDFKTPLSIMRTSLYLVNRKSPQPNPVQNHIDTLESQVTQIQRLLDDLLTMSRLDQASMTDFKFNLHDLNALVSDVLTRHHILIEEKGHQVLFEPDEALPAIPLDAIAIRRVLDNLLLNAFVYTPYGGEIRIRTFQRGPFVACEIYDSGEGISQDYLPYIFNRFFRGDRARSSGAGGTGLGLPIARRIVEAHSGKIEAESSPGAGSTFRFWLPIDYMSGLHFDNERPQS